MTITFPSDTKDTIDSIRDAIGRDISFYVPTYSGCSVCTLDPITNTSTDSFCTTCSGVYWIKGYNVNSINAHISFGNIDELNWVTAGQFMEGDCRAQIEYTDTNVTIVDSSKYVEVDEKMFSIKDKIYRGIPNLNRILLNLKEEDVVERLRTFFPAPPPCEEPVEPVFRWWEEGGTGVIAAYQAKGVDNLSDSLIDLSESANHASLEGLPLVEWNATDGWIFTNGEGGLTTGVDMPQALGGTWLIQFTDYSGGNYLCGYTPSPMYNVSPSIWDKSYGYNVTIWRYVSSAYYDGETLNGNLGMSAKRCFRNGTFIDEISPGGLTAQEFAIFNSSGVIGALATVNVQALILYDRNLSDGEMNDIATAMESI